MSEQKTALVISAHSADFVWRAGGAIALIAATTPAVVRGARRRRSRVPDDEPFFIYVPGHGGDASGFYDLAARMGIDPSRVRAFDYRWAREQAIA